MFGVLCLVVCSVGVVADYHSSSFGGSVTVEQAYSFHDESPTNGSTDVSQSTSTWNVTIENLRGYKFNWTIETSPDVGTASADDASNGSKQVSLSGLSYSTEYTVYVNATNDTHSSENHWYTFTTEDNPYSYHTSSFGGSVTVEETPASAPTVVINFAGNLSDSGGPYWRPPGELTQLTGVWSDGYYTNDSRQSEDWMYINCTITNATTVYLDWLNGTTWTNGTYSLSNTAGDYWEINTSGTITTAEGYNYSFNINATGSGGSKIVFWNKTGLSGTATRRYVQLGELPVNISYQPLYCYDAVYDVGAGDGGKHDRLRHDQGTDVTATGAGMLNTTPHTDTVQNRSCAGFVGFWYDNDSCVMSDTLENAYFHFWFNTSDPALGHKGYRKLRTNPTGITEYSTNNTTVSTISYLNKDYHLHSGMLNLSSPSAFTDNDVFQYCFIMSATDIIVIANSSFQSFIIPNVPSNDSLVLLDSDSDSLNDYEELYVTFTNPFDNDTDNDGVTDWAENITGSDPNNFTDTTPMSAFDVDVSPDSWSGGTVDTGQFIQENFTFWQNGSTTLDIYIGVNGTNFSFDTYANWSSSGHDEYCGNFTNDSWAHETNIADVSYPFTTVLNTSFGYGSFGFGIRFWTPKSVSTPGIHEDFTVVIRYETST